ncbi:hypothetical protein PoMZ_10547 [Pyricularia oryzae]|uniref:Uncharacterized protein n=1 Tax=Pyricularia oryzae TaxID=318829 RepID=A0A4P7MXQ1_PYROR|nr:hypothetical protein PoMZ_10547 [Pyricularia oryzae]
MYLISVVLPAPGFPLIQPTYPGTQNVPRSYGSDLYSIREDIPPLDIRRAFWGYYPQGRNPNTVTMSQAPPVRFGHLSGRTTDLDCSRSVYATSLEADLPMRQWFAPE